MRLTNWLDGLRTRFMTSSRRKVRARKMAAQPSAQISGEALENRLLLTTTYINAGGPTLAADPAFLEDDAFQNGQGRSFRRRAAVDTSGVDASIPDQLFQSMLVDRRRSPDLQFNIPVESGAEYEVDLLFSEIWRGGFDAGVRVFDVSIEGDVVLDNFDIFAEAGARTALAKSFNVTTTDGNLDIDLSRVKNNPAISGIMVTKVNDGGNPPTNTPPTISDIANQTTDENETVGPLNFTVGDADGDSVSVTATSNNTSVVSPTDVVVSGTGDSRTVTVTPVTDATGVATVVLTASDGQATASESFTINVTDSSEPPPAELDILRLNAGAGAVGNFDSASPYVGKSKSTFPRRPASISNVPADIPQAVFQSNAWTPRRFGDLKFNIPTEIGAEYQVDLLFSETRRATSRTGARVFNVSIDGQQVLDNFDIFATAGQNSAHVETFMVTGDGNLDVDLSRIKNNPSISGIVLTQKSDAQTPTNHAPVLAAIADRTVTTGTQLQLNASATDVDGDTLTYSIDTAGLPGSPSISPTLGAFTWTPPSAGTFNVTVHASDGELSDSETFTVVVADAPPQNQPPVIAAIAAQQVTAGNTLVFNVSATDPDTGDTLTYSVGGSAPTGLAIGSSSGQVTWTPTTGQTGTFTVPVSVTDGTDSVSRNAVITVEAPVVPVNHAPTIAAIGNQTVEANTQLQVAVNGSDPDAGDTLTYSLLTAGLPGNPQIDASSGIFTWTPPNVSGPGFEVTVQVADAAGLTDTEAFSVFITEPSNPNTPPVLNPIGAQSGNVGQQLTFTASATDADVPPDTLSFFLDPLAPSGASINSATGVFTWTPASEGQFTFSVIVSDGTVSVNQSVTVTVGPAAANQAPVFGPIGNQAATVDQQLQFTLGAADPNNDTLTYSLVTTGLPGNPQVNASSGVFTWTPTESTPGIDVTVRVTDDGGLFDTATFQVTINPATGGGNVAPVFATVPNQSATAGTQVSFSVSATDADGDTLSYFVDPTAPTGLNVNGTTGEVTWTPTESDVGTVTFPVFVGDGTVNISTQVTIVVSSSGGGNGGGNVAPSFGPQNNRSIAAGATLTTTITATDDNPGDTLTYSIVTAGLPGGPTINATTGVLTWTPPTSVAGQTFNVTVRATDNGGLSDETTVTVNVLNPGTGNQPPVIDAIGNQQATAGVEASFNVTATDADGDTLEYFLDPTAPFGVDINSSTGEVTWTPTNSDIGTVTFPVFVGDGTTNRSTNVTIVVSANTGGGQNTPPSMAPIENQTIDEGSLLTVTPVVDDPDTGEVLTFELLTNDLPGNATVNASTGVFTWTPPANAGSQSYVVNIRVTDSAGASATGSFSVQVN